MKFIFIPLKEVVHDKGPQMCSRKQQHETDWDFSCAQNFHCNLQEGECPQYEREAWETSHSLSKSKSLGYQGPSSHPSKGSLEVHREGDLFEEDA